MGKQVKKRYRSSYKSKKPENDRKPKRQQRPQFRVSRAGNTYRINKTQQQPKRQPKLRLATTPITKKEEGTHKEQRLQQKQKAKQTDQINKTLILKHLQEGTTSQQKLKQLLSDIKSRGLRQRLSKKISIKFR